MSSGAASLARTFEASAPWCRAERAATALAVVSLALWLGGLMSLGAVAAPIVFRIVPAPLSGDAMGAVFRRFDALAVGCAVVVLGSEAVRIQARRHLGASRWDQLRAGACLAAAASAIYEAVVLSPGILSLHAAGAIRGFGSQGLELERLHDLAELTGKLEVTFCLLAIVLHVLTVGAGVLPRRTTPGRTREPPTA
jgi:hypothetical protein